MKIFAEKEAEEFLKKQGFEVVQTYFTDKESKIKKNVDRTKFPIVMKVSGRKILHKNFLGGVKTNIKNYEQAVQEYKKLRKIKNSQGVLIQKQIAGKEFILGIKKTEDFGQIIAFGIGGVKVEKIKKISFRVLPLTEKDANEIIKEITNKNALLKKNILKLNNLAKKFPSISELDINPLILRKNKAIIVDARIIFD